MSVSFYFVVTHLYKVQFIILFRARSFLYSVRCVVSYRGCFGQSCGAVICPFLRANVTL